MSILAKVENGQEAVEQAKKLALSKWNASLTNDEAFLLAGFFHEKDFSPFSNDVYVISYGGKNQILVSIEGMRKIAKKSGGYSLKFVYFDENGDVSEFPKKNLF